MALNQTFLSFSSLSPSLSYPTSSAPPVPFLPSLSPLFNTTPQRPAPTPSVVGNKTSSLMGALILSLASLLGVPGNLFIIWSILARARRRSVTTLIILHLACADGFLMALCVFFVVYLLQQSWVFGNPMCKALFYLCCANMYASILLIALMSVHRLAVVMKPRWMRAFADRSTVLRLLGALWVLVLLLSLPALLFRQQKRVPVSNSSKSRLVCSPNHSLPEHVIFQYTFETTMGFILPYGVIIYSYVCILRHLRRTCFHRRLRSEKLILAIICTFGIFWLPYHISNIVQVVAQICPQSSPLRTRLEEAGKSSRAVTSALAFISSCANPVLYAFAGKSYMQQEGLGFMARLFEFLDSSGRTIHEVSPDPTPLSLKGCEAEPTASPPLGPAHSSALSPSHCPAHNSTLNSALSTSPMIPNNQTIGR
ncbi:hypothetical protein GJAV_G00155620 [Gymnothorax javanicus]|nr:hypothetical protein GJAV_G00155620 [Gymnothorax javanicus]